MNIRGATPAPLCHARRGLRVCEPHRGRQGFARGRSVPTILPGVAGCRTLPFATIRTMMRTPAPRRLTRQHQGASWASLTGTRTSNLARLRTPRSSKEFHLTRPGRGLGAAQSVLRSQPAAGSSTSNRTLRRSPIGTPHWTPRRRRSAACSRRLREENRFIRGEPAVRTEKIRRRDYIGAVLVEQVKELPGTVDVSQEHVPGSEQCDQPGHEARKAMKTPAAGTAGAWRRRWRQAAGGG